MIHSFIEVFIHPEVVDNDRAEEEVPDEYLLYFLGLNRFGINKIPPNMGLTEGMNDNNGGDIDCFL